MKPRLHVSNLGAWSSLLMAAILVAAPLTHVQAQFVFTDVADEASLAALWELNEAAESGTVVGTNGVSSYTGTVVGNTQLGVSSAMTTLDTAAYFSGASGNRIAVPHDAALNPESYTIQAWVQVQGGSSYRSPLTSRTSSPAQGYMFYAHASGYWDYWGGTGSTWATTPGPDVILDQWIHLAATYEHSGSGTRVFYLNGHPVATRTGTLAANSVTSLSIGAGGNDGTSYHFNGAVDNVAVLNQSLPHQNIANHFNAKSSYAVEVAADAPAAYWRLGEQAGTSAYNALDVASHTGTYSNVTLRQMASPFGNDVDTAAAFPSASSKVTVPYDADLNPSDSFTIEAWARVDGGEGTYRTVLSSRDSSGGSYGFTLYAANNDLWQFRVGTGSSSSWHTTNASGVAPGEWVHLVGAYDAGTSTKTFYINGAQVTSESGVAYAPNATNDFFIGMGGNSGSEFPFNGLIDEVAVYDHALMRSAVNRHFLLGNTGAEFHHWVGGGGDQLWSNVGNWDPAGSPAGKIVLLDNVGASATAGDATNRIGANVSVASMSYENTADNHHTTVVEAGSTLTLASSPGTPRIYVAEHARIDGQLGSSQGITKIGAGTLTLGGSGGSVMNIGGSGVTVSEGTLRLERSDLSFDTGVFHTNTSIRVESGAALEIAQKWNVRHSNVVAVDGGTLDFTWTHASRDDSENYLNYLNLTDATVTGYGIRVGNASSALFAVSGDAGTTISNPLILVNSATTPRTLTLEVADGAAADDLILSGVIRDYSESLAGTAVVKTGDGTLRLDGLLDYSADTIVNGGTLVLNRIGSLSSGHPGQFVSSGHTMVVNDGATLRVNQSYALGDGAQHEVMVNGGTLDFRSGHNYQNQITLTGGAITTHDDDPESRPWRTGYYAGNALITVNESDVSSTISGLLCFVKATSGTPGKTTFHVADGSAEHDLIVSAAISDHPPASSYGGMVLVKDGPGTMVLREADNTFIGGVDLNAGTLLVNDTPGSGSGTGTGPVAVKDGGTLGGAGTIAGATTIEGGGTLATGTSVGALTFGSTLTLEDGAIWDWEFINNTAGNYDQADGPNLVLPTDGDITLNIRGLDGHTVGWYDEFTIFTGEVENFNAGLFQLENHSDWTRGWKVFVGNSLVLMAVPEPGAWLLLLSALACGMLVRRRRRAG